jgi:hypothetical protein
VHRPRRGSSHLNGGRRRYVSYLLRLWQTNTGGRPAWRASLESPQTGHRVGFASLADLFAYLDRGPARTPRTQVPSDSNESGSGTRS